MMIKDSFTVIKFKYKAFKSNKHKASKDICFLPIEKLVVLVNKSFPATVEVCCHFLSFQMPIF